MINLPRYSIGENLHQGINTALYRGIRRTDGACVILKIPSGYASTRVIAALKHEHGILSELDLPGVVKAHGVDMSGDTVALVLEDLGGEPLSALIAAKRLDLKTSLSIASSLAATLAALHELQILHKDVKPQNILVSESGKVSLIDFGIAARLPREIQHATRPDVLEGTLAYMSPEQTGRMNRMIDYRSDLYSLGVTLYEMLTGVLPFVETDALEVIHAHIARLPVPPHKRVEGVPVVVSEIVMKLLMKAAEERYQTAQGLKADLDECLDQLSRTGGVAPFPLGQHDLSSVLSIPQKLYGREAEIEQLFSAFERASGGAAELLLVTGTSGVGKSALVREVHKPIAHRGGNFISGKFDQLNRSVPYEPIANAFRDLVRQILSEPPEALATWKAKVTEALGASAPMFVGLIPELEFLIGSVPPAHDIGTSEAQNRFALAFQRFLKLICAPGRALVLFLDDLQWADAASMKLLQLALTSADRGYLLVIGAYRDNEVTEAHPVALALDELRKLNVLVRTVTLRPLDGTRVAQLIADTVGRRRAEVAMLADLVWTKTQGNPFFLNQFLQLIHKDGLLTLDAATKSWRWDLERIEEAAATDNVVEFMAGKIRRLSPTAQRVLELAACIGYRFDLSTLGAIHERSTRETAQDLWEALREGLVIPLDSSYRFVHDLDAEGDSGSWMAEEFGVTYRFMHDRIQQAAYSLLDAALQNELHLKIGRLLLAEADRAALDPQIFEITAHLNRGASLMTSPEERLELARLNLAAAGKAKAATAYEAGVGYCEAGIALLPSGSWETDYELTFGLHHDRAHCEQLTGRLDAAASLLAELLPHAKSRLDALRVKTLLVLIRAVQGRFVESLSTARDALAPLGIDIPTLNADLSLDEEHWGKVLEADLAELTRNLAGRRPADLLSLPLMTDPELCAAQRLLMFLTPTALFLNITLLRLVSVKQVNLSLTHGHTETSGNGYMYWGACLVEMFRRCEEAYEYGLLALELNEKFQATEMTCRLNELFAALILPYSKPLRMSLEYLDRGFRAGLDSGDFQYLSFITGVVGIHRSALGDELGALGEATEKFLAMMQWTKEAVATLFHRVNRQRIANLTGRTTSIESLSDETFNEVEFVAMLNSGGLPFIAFQYYLYKTEILFLYGFYAEALAMAIEAERRVSSGPVLFHTTEVPFYMCLVLLALYRSATNAERERYDRMIEDNHAKLVEWVKHCPDNFRHKLLLVDAERARVAGSADAIRLYEQAISTARASGFPHHEAMANELCAQFYQDFGSPVVARNYLANAHAGYRAWGAVVKVARLEEEYQQQLTQFNVETSSVSITTTSQRIDPDILDVAAIIRATQAVASEIVLPRVVDRLLRIAATNAGAQKGALLLKKGEELLVEAIITVEPELVELELGLPMESRPELPRTILNFVARTRQVVVLGDATTDARFGLDPAVVQQAPRSIVCIPLIFRGNITGLLYLENSVARDVFYPARVELLGWLSSQAAIAVENATLLATVEAATAEIRRANERLEDEVAQRTSELRQSNQELGQAKERLEIELVERARAEEERARLQQEFMAAQEARIAELSTPFIPIMNGVMVMPLIGTLDSRRAQQVLEVALSGAQAHAARTVILDVTGIKHADADVANTLIRTTRALGLLGVSAILSGLRSEVAQTLVDLGIDLSAITTRGTLQSAVAHALSAKAQVRKATDQVKKP